MISDRPDSNQSRDARPPLLPPPPPPPPKLKHLATACLSPTPYGRPRCSKRCRINGSSFSRGKLLGHSKAVTSSGYYCPRPERIRNRTNSNVSTTSVDTHLVLANQILGYIGAHSPCLCRIACTPARCRTRGPSQGRRRTPRVPRRAC